MCKTEGCETPSFTRDLCRSCYAKWWRSGKFEPKQKRTPKKDFAYRYAHQKVQNLWGKANEHFCIFGPPHKAQDWACVKEFADELVYATNHNGTKKKYPYSTNPNDYVPMCKHHHAREDKWGFSQVLLEECVEL